MRIINGFHSRTLQSILQSIFLYYPCDFEFHLHLPPQKRKETVEPVFGIIKSAMGSGSFCSGKKPKWDWNGPSSPSPTTCGTCTAWGCTPSWHKPRENRGLEPPFSTHGAQSAGNSRPQKATTPKNHKNQGKIRGENTPDFRKGLEDLEDRST